jgi:MFS family permease
MSERSGAAPLAARLGLTASATAAIATVVAVGTAISLMPPLLSIMLSARGVSERTIGLLVSTIAVASLATTPLAPRLAARFGTARTIVAALLVAAILIPVYWWVEALILFFPLALIYGACLSTVFVLSEAWINAVTDERHRGTVMGIYATVLSLGFASGPAILAAVGMDSLRPFLIGSAILFLATLPVLAARRVSPEFGGGGHQPVVGFLFAVPLATFGVFCFAMAESGGFAFLPLWGMRLGYEKATAPLFASAMTLGNVALQIPLGLLADRIDRRTLLAACGAAGMFGMAAAAMVSGNLFLLMPVLFVWGGATAGLYTVGLAHLASRVRAADLAGANAAFIFAYSLGMLVGPLGLGETMGHLPLTGFPLYLGTIFALYTAFTLWRIARAPRR